MPKRFWLALALLLVLFFPLLWISQYNYPSGDDYFIAFLARRLGPLGATRWWYSNLSGRFSFLFLESLILGANGWLTLYKLFPAALLAAGFGCVYYFVRAVWGRGFSRTTSFIFAAALYALLVSLTPDIATGFYWLTTSIQYSGAVFTSLLILALYLDFSRARRRLTRAAYALLITLLVVLLSGLNEVSAIWLIAVFGFIAFLHVARFQRPPQWALIFLALSVAFGLISFLSAGTHFRIAQAGGGEFHPLNFLAGALGLTLYLLIELLTTTPLLPATIIYFAFLNANREKLDRLASLLRCVRWYWILIFMILAITAVNFVVFKAVGVNSLLDRVKNVYVYSIFFGWLLLATALFFDLSDKKINLSIPNWATGTLAAFVFGFLLTGYSLKVSSDNMTPAASQWQRFFSLLSTNSVYANAYLDILSGRAERFSGINLEREERLRSAGGGAVEFPLYSYVPETIFIQDVNHPFGSPTWMSVMLCGEARSLDYVETGPPPLPKKKF